MARPPDALGPRFSRLLCARIERARRLLERSPRPTDWAVHETRKQIKKARAILKLLRGPIGESFYQRQNRRLREVAARLSPLRDASVLADALVGLPAGLRRRNAAELRGVEREQRCAREAERRRFASSGQRREALTGLARCFRDCADMNVRLVDRKAVREGLHQSYRRLRRRWRRAESEPSVAVLHEWRKQVRCLQNQLASLRILRLLPEIPGRLQPVYRGVAIVADRLGEDHDRAMLGQWVASGEALGPLSRNSAILAIGRRRLALQKQAFAAARRSFSAGPGRVAAEIARHAGDSAAAGYSNKFRTPSSPL